MPSYGTYPSPQPLYPGNNRQVITVGDAVAGNVTKTIALEIARPPAGGSAAQNYINSTNQAGTIYAAATDADANYVSTGYDVGAGASLPFNCIGPYVRIQFALAPTSGTFTVSA